MGQVPQMLKTMTEQGRIREGMESRYKLLRDRAMMADVSRAVQEAIVDTLVARSCRAIESTGHARLVIAGGVGANRLLRERLAAGLSRYGATVYYPRTGFCTDNAAMIAFTGCLRLAAAPDAFRDLHVMARPRWPLEELRP